MITILAPQHIAENKTIKVPIFQSEKPGLKIIRTPTTPTTTAAILPRDKCSRKNTAAITDPKIAFVKLKVLNDSIPCWKNSGDNASKPKRFLKNASSNG